MDLALEDLAEERGGGVWFDLGEETQAADLDSQERHLGLVGQLSSPQQRSVSTHRQDQIESASELGSGSLLVCPRTLAFQASRGDRAVSEPTDQGLGGLDRS